MTTRTAIQKTHTHWFEIDPPDGPTSKGVCRDCGATREFLNCLTDEQELEAAHAKPPTGYVERLAYTNPVWW